MKRIRSGRVADEIRGGIGNGAEDGVVRRSRTRGHVTLGAGMWMRIRREFAAGASVPWLSARYGAGERTIGARAKREGWRRKDLAEAADAELEAAEARGDADPVATPAIGKGLGLDGSAREAAAFAAALAGVDEKARDGAKVEALNRAVAWMKRGDASAAMVWARLAGTLEGLAKAGGVDADEAGDPAAQDAAMAVLCERLGVAPPPGVSAAEPLSPCTPANAGVQITGVD